MEDGNGKLKPGEPNPGIIDPKDKVLVLSVYIDKKTQRVSIEGLIDKKQLCLNVLGEAVKTIANFEPPRVTPVKGFIPGVRNFLGKH